MMHTPIAFALAVTPALALSQPPSQLSPPAPATTIAPQLSLDHRMLVRCSAAFAIIASDQNRGDADASRYPVLAQRGQEFFVRASAQVMEEAGLSREQIAAALTAEARDLRESGTIGEVMPVCLGLLPAE